MWQPWYRHVYQADVLAKRMTWRIFPYKAKEVAYDDMGFLSYQAGEMA